MPTPRPALGDRLQTPPEQTTTLLDISLDRAVGHPFAVLDPVFVGGVTVGTATSTIRIGWRRRTSGQATR